ncbi:MAG: hypothetical protein AAF657_15930, partial [Acidobacteriota bacterium]
TILGVGLACLALPLSIWWRRSSIVSRLLLAFGASAAFICTFLGLVPVESVFVFYPAIDTQTTPGFSRSTFLGIEPGMSDRQVLERVGEPASRRSWGDSSCRVDFDQTWDSSRYSACGWDDAACPSYTARRDFDEMWGYSRDGACGWCDAAWRSYMVYFRAGSVIRAVEQWHCD